MSEEWTTTTRRDAVRRGFWASGAAIAASGVPQLLRAPIAVAQTGGDLAIAKALIEVEQSALVAYQTVALREILKGDLQDTARLFGEQAQEHLDLLTATLDDLGGTAPQPPKAQDVEGLADVKTKRDFLGFAIELENTAVLAYDDAAAKLVSAELVKTGAEIVSNRAQHLAVLRGALDIDPIPDAFEMGQSKP